VPQIPIITATKHWHY